MISILDNLAISLSEEQGMLLDVARNFVRDQAPMEVVRAQLETSIGYDQAVWKDMVEMGWSGIALPDLVGGAGLNVGSAVPVFEALGYGLLGTPLLSTTLAGQLIWRAAGESSACYLRRLCGGEVATVAFLDDSDWGATNCNVIIDNSGCLVGRKYFVPDASVAQLFAVLVTDSGEPAIALVDRSLLPADAISANACIDLTKRSANVDFTGVEPNEVFRGESVTSALRDFRLLGALFVSAETVGAAGRTLSTIVEYLKTRKQFGKHIGSYQALKHPTVEIYVGMENARSLIYHGATIVGEATLSDEADIACRMSKISSDHVMLFAGDRSVQFHGGFGFTWDCDSSLFIRRAQWAQQMFGDSIHHKKRLALTLLDT